MFTVIFAEKETIKLFEETKMFYGPLYNSEHLAFCEWNKYAEDFESMVPDLYDLIKYKSDWRAIILYNDVFDRQNPFDYTMYSEEFYSQPKKDWEFFKNRRKNRLTAYENAVSNPLVKLTTALCGIPGFNSALTDEEYEKMVSGEEETYEYMLEKQLSALNCTEMAARFDKFQRDILKRFVEEEKIDELISYLRDADVSGIIKLIPDTEILDFIKLIGNDPIYYDPEYTECLIENTQKCNLLRKIAENFSLKDQLPGEVICLSPRTFDFEKTEQDIKWKKKDEISYSKFAEYNLYSEKLKLIFLDVVAKDKKQYKFDQLKLLCTLLVIANYGIPQGLINTTHVYRAQIDFNDSIITRMCENYIGKLKSTQILLKEIEMQKDIDEERFVDDKTAQRLFESDINIPVRFVSSTDESELYAEYKEIGLSRDCPTEESVYWSKQYRSISKRFVRYLREPRRAVKSAVVDGLHKNNVIDDDRTLHLTENQLEDVKFHLIEVEQKMIETKTTQLFDTKKFTEQLQEADKEVQDGISQRMTKKKTLFVGLFAAIAYFAGFLPLLFGNLNTIKSFLFSLLMTGCVVGVFLIIGIIYLIVLKTRLIKKIRHFNHVMSEICGQITEALGQFSNYLTCACNVMRDFSVLRKRESSVNKTKKILAFHNDQIIKQIKCVNEMFSKYIDFNKIEVKECEPYDFDFCVIAEYEYEMPSIHSVRKIEYLQQGNEIIIPIDYVESIILTREDLYD